MTDTRTTNEILAAHEHWSYDRTDRNGTRYFSNYVCPRCGGRGVIEAYAYIDGGICFECGGAGRTHKPEIIKIYTPEHEAKLAADRAKRAAAKLEAKRAEYRDHMSEKLQELGFGIEDGIAVLYRVIGNTYPIKDELKARGCKFNACVGWYAPTELDGYECQRMLALEAIHFNEEKIALEWFPVEQVKARWSEVVNAKPVTSVFQGTVGERLDVEVTVDRVLESQFTFNYRNVSSNLHIMHDADGNVYTWSTQKCLTEGETYHLRGTVKDHQEYKGVQQTVLTRCTLVKE